MRVWKYMKIDLIKTRKVLLVLCLIPVMTVVLQVRSDELTPYFTFMYCMFAGIVSASLPFNCEANSESGFLKMLPGKPGDDIKGHYLYTFGALIGSGVMGMLATYVSALLMPDEGPIDEIFITGLYPVILGVALIFSGLENVFLCLFRNDNVLFMRIFRMIPPFVFFFGLTPLLDYSEELEQFLKLTLANGWICCLLCIVIFAIFAQLSCIIAKRRDEL